MEGVRGRGKLLKSWQPRSREKMEELFQVTLLGPALASPAWPTEFSAPGLISESTDEDNVLKSQGPSRHMKLWGNIFKLNRHRLSPVFFIFVDVLRTELQFRVSSAAS